MLLRLRNFRIFFLFWSTICFLCFVLTAVRYRCILRGWVILKYALTFVSSYCFPLGFVPAKFMQRGLLFCHCWNHGWHWFSDNCVLNFRDVLKTTPSLLRFLSRKQEVTGVQIMRERMFGWGGDTTMFLMFKNCLCLCSSVSIRVWHFTEIRHKFISSFTVNCLSCLIREA
jgi:hypothetical protein